ncbi:MAG: hypothetical protein V3T14_00145 [Myxococcota bacterium]
MARLASLFPHRLIRKAFGLEESTRPRVLETVQPVVILRDVERDHARSIWREYSLHFDQLHNPVGDLRPTFSFEIPPTAGSIAVFKRIRINDSATIVHDLTGSPIVFSTPAIILGAGQPPVNWQNLAGAVTPTDSLVIHRQGQVADLGATPWRTRVLPSDDAPVIPFEFTLVPGIAFLFQIGTTLVDFHGTVEWMETALTDTELPRVPVLAAA